MNKRRVTLLDIAKEAGVHVTTVSLALRNNPRLPEATRARIKALADKLGYAPDPLLKALVAYRGRIMTRRNPPTLAYVTNWNSRLGWKKVTAHPDFYAGALAKAEELGYHLEHFWMREPGLTHGRLSRILYSRGINGLIIASHVREIDVGLHFDWERFSARAAAAQRDEQPVRHHPAGDAAVDGVGVSANWIRDAPRLGPQRGSPVDGGVFV
jgi:LacI family transcriptional regulator